MEINPQAPVMAEDDTYIRPSRELVWEILTNLTEWPEWNQDVERVYFEGRILPGEPFEWRAHGFSVMATIEEVIPGERLVWSATSLANTKIIHVWILEDTPDGTHVITRTSVNGWLPRMLKSWLQTRVEQSTTRSLTQLKTAAESVAGQ